MSSKKDQCQIHNELVNWTIPKNNIDETMIGLSKNGILYKKYETAGKIQFTDHNCNKKKQTCDKTMNTSLDYKNGNSDSVLTPLAVVNFHTHPLNCYIEGDTIWGWASGEDLKECINFALNGNLTHIIFAIEGTYIIDVNKKLLNTFQNHPGILDGIESVFQLTHKYRMYNAEDSEFDKYFLKTIKLNLNKFHILHAWIHLVNNLTINNVNILSEKLFGKTTPLGDNNKINNIKIYNIKFVPNKTVQWDKKLSKKELFNQMKITKPSKIDIILPNRIEYEAPFVSNKCKL